MSDLFIGVNIALVTSVAPAVAHVSEQGFVLLLPTAAYTVAGVAVVALTALLMIVLPPHITLFPTRQIIEREPAVVSSLISLVLLAGLIWIGQTGPRDPLSNLMPLAIWTVFWIGLVSLAGVFGNLWHWLNPWTGLYRVIMGQGEPRMASGHVWPAALILLAFTGFALADPAPDDPARISLVVGLYWLVQMILTLLLGPEWLRRGEVFTVLFRLYGDLALISGVPGWLIITRKASLSLGVFALLALGTGSFDGVNETFWWLAQIGVNPLEFPGRSAVVMQTLGGLLLSCLALILAFLIVIWLGTRLVRMPLTTEIFARMALTLLPIALAYHVAHFLTSFLVGYQYVIAALTDPFATGADFLGIEPFYVTTGFFNRISSVRVIWLTQAGVVVLGHVWAILLAHSMAQELFGRTSKATLATLPLSLFMIAYTLLGLWLLAAPRGA